MLEADKMQWKQENVGQEEGLGGPGPRAEEGRAGLVRVSPTVTKDRTTRTLGDTHPKRATHRTERTMTKLLWATELGDARHAWRIGKPKEAQNLLPPCRPRPPSAFCVSNAPETLPSNPLHFFSSEGPPSHPRPRQHPDLPRL